MMADRARHPSAAIPPEIVSEISYRVYLLRLEPPMTPEQSVATTRHDEFGRVIGDDASRRRNSVPKDSMTRDYLRVLVDMGLVKP